MVEDIQPPRFVVVWVLVILSSELVVRFLMHESDTDVMGCTEVDDIIVTGMYVLYIGRSWLTSFDAWSFSVTEECICRFAISLLESTFYDSVVV